MLIEILSGAALVSVGAAVVYVAASMDAIEKRHMTRMHEFHDAMQRDRLRSAMGRVQPAPETVTLYDPTERVCHTCNRVLGAPGVTEGVLFQQCPLLVNLTGRPQACLKWRSVVPVWAWQAAKRAAAEAQTKLDFAKPLAGSEGQEQVVFQPTSKGDN